ncbi:NAD(P)-dependent oxidoreductase [Sporosarcina sp. FA9]|uniref:NAD(P)-dependent oxidoreductase n=1 Tax=Sporosarcina sp. FA9 TaxID=3413030 RepID=UPI003F6590A5
MKEKRIGFIGLGNMGLPMAMNLLKGGQKLSVFDKNVEAVNCMVKLGAKACVNAKEVAEKSSIIFISLPNSPIIESVIIGVDGVLEGFKNGEVIIDMSSADPSSTRKISDILLEKGVTIIDAPVSGGPEAAAEGTLSIMVGSSEADYLTYKPLLSLLGTKVSHVGEVSSGHSIKAINNLLYGTIFVASCEAMALGVKSGIKAEKLLSVISASAGRNFAIDVKFPGNVMSRNFKPGFSTDLLNKDMDIALSLAKEQNVPVVLSQAASQFITMGIQKGYGKLDHTALIQFFEEFIGMEVKQTEGGKII